MREPKYRQHSQRDFGFSEVRGQRIRFPGKYNSDESLEAYHDLCAKLKRERLKPTGRPLVADDAITVRELCLAYLEHVERQGGISEADHKNTVLALRYLWRHFGAVKAREFGPLKLAELQQILAATVRKNRHGQPVKDGRTLTRSYIGIVVYRIRRMFSWASAHEHIPGSIPAALETVPGLKPGRSPARESTKRRPVPFRDLLAVVREIHPMLADMIRLHGRLGVRGSSLCRAKPEQFDCSGKLWIWKPRHKTEKLGHELTVFIGRKCQKILKPYLKAAKPDQYLFSPRVVFNGKRVRPRYYGATYAHAIKATIDRINRMREEQKKPLVGHWTPHQLRHAKGHIVRARFGLEAAQAVLGHQSLSSTQVYSEARLALARLVAEQTG